MLRLSRYICWYAPQTTKLTRSFLTWQQTLLIQVSRSGVLAAGNGRSIPSLSLSPHINLAE